jgi:hypothetical protein
MKEKVNVHINHYNIFTKEKNSSKWLNHLQRSYGLSKMSIILGFGIVWGLTKGLQNLWIHMWTLPLPKLIDFTILSPSC